VTRERQPASTAGPMHRAPSRRGWRRQRAGGVTRRHRFTWNRRRRDGSGDLIQRVERGLSAIMTAAPEPTGRDGLGLSPARAAPAGSAPPPRRPRSPSASRRVSR